MNAPVPDCVVRPPWPDELPRVAEAFPALGWQEPMHLHVLVVIGVPERLVGVAAVRPPAEKDRPAELSLIVRPRHLPTPRADELLAAALATAHSLGVRAIELGRPIAPNDPRRAVLKRAGFRFDPAEQGDRTVCDLAAGAPKTP